MTTPTLITSLATTDDARNGVLAYLFRDVDDATLTTDLERASRSVEAETHKRLLPFTETEDMGLVKDPYYVSGLNVVGWVDWIPPKRPELWTGAITALQFISPWRDPGWPPTIIDPATVQFLPQTGVVRFQAADFPVPVTCRITYTGGYGIDPNAVPDDLVQATVLWAAVQRIRGGQTGVSVDTAIGLSQEVMSVLAPWSAACGSTIA